MTGNSVGKARRQVGKGGQVGKEGGREETEA